MLTLDEGYFFGIGAFETVGVEEGNPVLLREHYERLKRSLEFFHLETSIEMIAEKVEKELEKPGMNVGRKVLKITVSEKNILVTSRVNTYQKVDYQIGFSADFSKVRRE